MSLWGFVMLLALLLAAAEWYAVLRQRRGLEWVFKPATLVALLVAAGLLSPAARDARMAMFFLAGLAFSLAGDVLLLLPGTRAFIAGLASFLLAHLAYLAGLTPTPPSWPAPLLLIPIALVAVPLFRRVLEGMRGSGHARLIAPVAAYAVVLSLMLFSAWATLFRPEWSAAGRAVVVTGGTLFFASDSMLAWNMFVAPSTALRLRVMITYHLAQCALATAILLA